MTRFVGQEEYDSIKGHSYSSLKNVYSHPLEQKEVNNEGSTIGNYVDSMLTEPDKLKEKYFISSVSLSDSFETLGKYLIQNEIEYTLENVMKVKEDLELFKNVKKPETMLAKCNEANLHIYLQEYKDNRHKTFITIEEKTKAEICVANLKSSISTKQFFETSRYVLFFRKAIIKELAPGLVIKGRPDAIVYDKIDHCIFFADFKYSFSLTQFFFTFWSYEYYLQAQMYNALIGHVAKAENLLDELGIDIKEKGLPKVLPGQYLVFNESSGAVAFKADGPLMTSKNILNNGRYYIGVKQRIKDIRDTQNSSESFIYPVIWGTNPSIFLLQEKSLAEV